MLSDVPERLREVPLGGLPGIFHEASLWRFLGGHCEVPVGGLPGPLHELPVGELPSTNCEVLLEGFLGDFTKYP